VPAIDFAIIDAGLGRADSTAAWLLRAIDDHSIRPFLMEATFDKVRPISASEPCSRDCTSRTAVR